MGVSVVVVVTAVVMVVMVRRRRMTWRSMLWSRMGRVVELSLIHI